MEHQEFYFLPEKHQVPGHIDREKSDRTLSVIKGPGNSVTFPQDFPDKNVLGDFIVQGQFGLLVLDAKRRGLAMDRDHYSGV